MSLLPWIIRGGSTTEESGRGIWGLLPAMLARKGSRRGRPCPRARMALARYSQDKPWPTAARTGPGPILVGHLRGSSELAASLKPSYRMVSPSWYDLGQGSLADHT